MTSRRLLSGGEYYFPYSVEDELGLSKAVDAYYKAGKFEESRLASAKFLSLTQKVIELNKYYTLGQRVIVMRSISLKEIKLLRENV